MKFLCVYCGCDPTNRRREPRLNQRRRALGHDVLSLDIALNGRWLPFPELDRRWRLGDRALLGIYERLVTLLEGREVLINLGGANLHPDFLRHVRVTKIFTCADDPESTEILSRPVAQAYDAHFIHNVAAVEMYRGWGLPRVEFLPLGSTVFAEDVADLTAEAILDVSSRPVPLFMACERVSPWRQERLDRLCAEFPMARFVGRGWPASYIDDDELWRVYRQTQVGWNLHNSTGPINFRTYDLAAFGVLQLCDNRQHLGHVFEVGREVIGFETLEECMDLTRYFLAHPAEQRRIALAGHQRWRRDYTPDAVWTRLVARIQALPRPGSGAALQWIEVRTHLAQHRHKTRWRRWAAAVGWLIALPRRALRKAARLVARMFRSHVHASPMSTGMPPPRPQDGVNRKRP